LTLASGRMPGTSIPGDVRADMIVAEETSEATRTTIARAQHPSQAIALALGSPEFQRR
jgi:hypothetical protein